MHIESLRLRNFRCFGEPRGVTNTITFDPTLTAFVGSNGAGKTTILIALQKLFGGRLEDRRLTREDIHFSPNEEPGPEEPKNGEDLNRIKQVQSREMEIEVILAFPELGDGSTKSLEDVPEIFRAMSARGPGEPLKARIRLEATWSYGIDEDDISSKMYWVTSLGDIPFGEEDISKMVMSSHDRRRFQFWFLPATRDGGAVVRQALKELLGWLTKFGDWDAGRDPMAEQWKDLQELFDKMPAIGAVSEELTENWGRLFDGAHLRNPRLTVISREIQRALKELSLTLGPGPDGRHRSVQELSEGQASLLYIALVITLMRLEVSILSTPTVGFKNVEILRPWLTVIALEEPENHLAPFYLSKMISLMKELTSDFQAMGVITTHSPSTLRRVLPTQIRYVRQDPKTLSTRVRSIKLPKESDDLYKFIYEAVRSHPELYFSRLVILGEGRSEEIVIPRLADSRSLNLDTSFVAFVPLGGRHVNHFWRLLEALEIPYLTLLDYDLGRHDAGPLRLRYAINQLREIGREITKAIPYPDKIDDWRVMPLPERILWKDWLATQGVFFSTPLDLDMSMVKSFPDVYYSVATLDKIGDMKEYEASVFGKGPGLNGYASPEKAFSAKNLACYEALFKSGSKPVAHIDALSQISDETLKTDCPPQIKLLLDSCSELLNIKFSEFSG